MSQSASQPRQESSLGGDETLKIRRVRFSDGGTFDTKATSASHYLLDPCFIRFLFLCVILYGVLAVREDLKDLGLYENVMIWMALFTSTTLWLLLSVSINVKLVDKGYVPVIFTPALFLPLVPLNVFISIELALILGTPNMLTFSEMIKPIVQNLITFICFDILHGRYVAPTHPTTVRSGKTELDTDRWRIASPETPRRYRRKKGDLSSVAAAPSAETSQMKPLKAAIEPIPILTIGAQKFALDQIRYIKSEDHYLNVQLVSSNTMVRGNLGQTIKQLPAKSGGQVNRSVWVAFRAVTKVEEGPKAYSLVTLDDGTSFRISSSRRLIFLSNFESFKSGNTSIPA